MTIPLTVQHDRPLVEAAIAAPDGRGIRAQALVDTGGGAVILGRSLARRLRLPLGEEASEDGLRLAAVVPPAMTVDGAPLAFSARDGWVVLDSDRVTPGGTAEVFLPGRVFRPNDLVFDYPAGRFRVLPPGREGRDGDVSGSAVELPATIHPDTGFPRIELAIAGETHGFLLDTGASFTMVSEALVRRLAAAHGRPLLQGAYGGANMTGDDVDRAALMTALPMSWGPIDLGEVVVVTRPEGIFERWMTSMMTGRVVGALGGNVLRRMRLRLSYRRSFVAVAALAPPRPAGDLDQVAVVLKPSPEGGYLIAKVGEGLASRGEVRVGDRLVAVDGAEVTGQPLHVALGALRGRPGQTRALTLEREGRVRIVRCPVERLLPEATGLGAIE